MKKCTVQEREEEVLRTLFCKIRGKGLEIVAMNCGYRSPSSRNSMRLDSVGLDSL
jgi:hypothetical protein